MGYEVLGKPQRSDKGSGLRIGEISRIIYPQDKASVSKRFMEYDVDVFSNGGFHKYVNCLLVNSFGSGADTAEFTLRADVNRTGLGKGAKVLVMSIDGQVDRAVIMGGIRDPSAQNSSLEIPTEQDGKHLKWEFNGIRVDISDNGKMQIKFKGPTDLDGKPLDQANFPPGATIEFSPNGDILIQHSEEKRLKYDYQNDQWRMDSTGSIELNNKSDDSVIQLNEFGIKQTTRQEIFQETGGRVIIKPGEHILLGGDESFYAHSAIKGSEYRRSQTELNNETTRSLLGIIQSLIGIQGSLSAMSIQIVTAGTAMIVPIVGAMVAGPILISMAASFVSINTALAIVVQSIRAVVSAISFFESGPTTRYLSEKVYITDEKPILP